MTEAQAWGHQDEAPATLEAILADRRSRGVLLAGAHKRDPIVTVFVAPDEARRDRLHVPAVIKIPRTPHAAVEVDRERQALIELNRTPLGPADGGVPRYLGSRLVDGRWALMMTVVPGSPLSTRCEMWGHTSRSRQVRRDFEAVARWLRGLQEATSGVRRPVTWAMEATDHLLRRWDGHHSLGRTARLLNAVDVRLRRETTPTTIVHGDLRVRNLLMTDAAVTGVIGWRETAGAGNPLRDVTRFALSYSLQLDRRTTAGHRVLGHVGLRGDGYGSGVLHAVLGSGWYPRLVRRYLETSLRRLGMSPVRWYDVALLGLAEIACQANDEERALQHLELLGRMPAFPPVAAP